MKFRTLANYASRNNNPGAQSVQDDPLAQNPDTRINNHVGRTMYQCSLLWENIYNKHAQVPEDARASIGRISPSKQAPHRQGVLANF